MVLPGGMSTTDFSGFPLADMGRTVSRTPITKTTHNVTGRETLTKGSPADITAVAIKWDTSFTQQETALMEGADAYIMVAPAVTLNEYDYITFDSDTYEVFKLTTIYVAGTAMYKYGLLRLKE